MRPRISKKGRREIASRRGEFPEGTGEKVIGTHTVRYALVGGKKSIWRREGGKSRHRTAFRRRE